MDISFHQKARDGSVITGKPIVKLPGQACLWVLALVGCQPRLLGATLNCMERYVWFHLVSSSTAIWSPLRTGEYKQVVLLIQAVQVGTEVSIPQSHPMQLLPIDLVIINHAGWQEWSKTKISAKREFPKPPQHSLAGKRKHLEFLKCICNLTFSRSWKYWIIMVCDGFFVVAECLKLWGER